MIVRLLLILLFTVPSGSPENLKIALVTSHTLNLSWSPPLVSHHNGFIMNYFIICSLRDSIIYSTRTSGPSLQLSITGLEPFTNYTCSVRAATVVGDGPVAVIHTMTNEDCKLTLYIAATTFDFLVILSQFQKHQQPTIL